MIKIKRIYEKAKKSDGYRILVDRIWPRGITKEEAHLGLWLKDIAPSDTLRKWFNHDPEKWAKFHSRYEKELTKKSECVDIIKSKAKGKTVTLLFGAKDVEHNNAVVLKDFLSKNRR